MRILLLVLLGCSLAEGLLSKCPLRKELLRRRVNNQVDENLLAQIVCSTDRMTSFNTSLVNRRTPRGGDEVWTLYGIFQFGNRLVCSDGASSAPNICQKSCKSFIDDDIDDDIDCLWRIFKELVENGFSSVHFEKLKTMIGFIFQEECKLTNVSDYFAECSGSLE